jgi:hypothetical protein
MTSCIDDVNPAAKFGEADENGDPKAALSFEIVWRARKGAVWGLAFRLRYCRSLLRD